MPAILELQRVTRHAVVLSSEEWLAADEERNRHLAARTLELHGERSIYADCDAGPLFAPMTLRLERQLVTDLDRFADDRNLDVAALRRHLLALPPASSASSPATGGVLLTALVNGTMATWNRRPSDAEIVDFLLGHASSPHRIPARTPAVPLPSWCELRCPSAAAPMRRTVADTVTCPTCERCWVRDNGVFELFCPREPELDPVAAALERRGNALPGQMAALRLLASKLSFQSLATDTAWDLRTPEGRSDWEWCDLEHDGTGCFRVLGPEPRLTSPWVGVPMARVRGLCVELAVIGTDGPGPATTAVCVYVLLSDMPDFAADFVLRFPVVADGQSQSIRIETPSGLRDSGRALLRLRLQLAVASCALRIERIAIETDAADGSE